MAELSTLGSIIKPAYEGQPDTNAFTDTLKQELDDIVSNMAVITTITTTDSTDMATAITLVNECKSKINAIIIALQV